MPLTRQTPTILLATLLLLGACGGNSVTGENNGNGNGSGNTSCSTKFSATVNGSAWCALSTASNYYANQQQVVIAGSGLVGGGAAWALTLSTSGVTAAGTYSLTSTSPLRFAVAGSSTGIGYSTTGPGSSGSITFTTFTTTHVVGTYSFTAVATSGGSGNVVVTNGKFDVTLTPGN